MEIINNFFNKLAGNFEFITFGVIGLVLFLLLIILFTGKKKQKSPKRIAAGSDTNLDLVMEQLRDTAENVQTLITNYRSQIGEQERESVERQMQAQQLEEQIYKMKSELELIDDVPEEVKVRVQEMNKNEAIAVKRKGNKRSYTMLIVGFLLGLSGFLLGRLYTNNTDLVMGWIDQLMK